MSDFSYPTPDHSAAFEQPAPMILVVDDDSSVRGLITAFLQREGYQVHPCESAPEALEFSKQCDGQIKMLITDVDMPEMSGWEFASRFCALKPGVPILFVSGLMEFPDSQPQKSLPTPVSFLHKPFTLGKLRQLVSSAFPKT